VATSRPTLDRGELDVLLEGAHTDPHHALGAHPLAPDGPWVVRALQPAVEAVALVANGAPVPMTRVHPGGLFEVEVGEPPPAGYRLEWTYPDGNRLSVGDPYRFSPTLGSVDLHLIGEGRHERLWEALGARMMRHEGVDGVAFSVWAPNARAVRLVGDFNGWDGRVHPMRNLAHSGVWELFLPHVGAGTRYKYEIVGADGRLVLKADPLARAAEIPPSTASVVAEWAHEWHDQAWMAQRASQPFDGRLSIYEVHLGSWRRNSLEGNRSLTYRELATELADHVASLGFTHVELLPVAEHPFGGSWGYQVTGFYAPTSRYGTPDDFRYLVDVLHQRGIGVIVDWVPAHFPRDDFALARFDGTALYEHADPRQGEHPDWGTLVFNYGRNEVRNFLLANALYWLDAFHIDGLRVDAVASMLYLDYSRAVGQWIPNARGGRENLEAISFLQELNRVVHAVHPGVLTIAEESTAWEGVSRPVDGGGLGFTHKWNMGWMHDTLEYFSKDPVYRAFDHDKLTFGLIYVWHENFISPLSHDEVVHGKGSLLGKMPGDEWQRFANLRALYAWMWAHPGKQLLFMGAELAQGQEWSEERSLDWHLLERADHAGVQSLVRDLNHCYRRHPALWEVDTDPAGFTWLEAADADRSVVAFVRRSADDGQQLVCVANLTPVPRDGYRVGLPAPGRWTEVLNTDAGVYGGSNVGNLGGVDAEPVGWHGQDHSAAMTLPPLGVLWFASP
jgi:1,4-alpha-glucan branching enzyme